MLLTWLWNWLSTLNTWTTFEWCLVGGVTLLVVGVLGVNLFYYVFPPPDPAESPPPRSTFPPAPPPPFNPGIALRREQQARLERERQARLIAEQQASAAPPAPPAPPVVTPHPPPARTPADPPAPEADAWLRDQARPTAPQAPPPSAPVSPGGTPAPETVILPPAPPSPPRAAPTSGGWTPQGLACAEAYQAIMQGRVTDLDEIRAAIAEFVRIQATPRERAALGWGIERALEDLEQLLAAREESDAAASSWPAGEEPLEAEERVSGPAHLASFLEEEEPEALAPLERAIGPVDPAFFGTDLDPLDLAWQDESTGTASGPPTTAAAPSWKPALSEDDSSRDEARATRASEAPSDGLHSPGEASLTLEAQDTARPGMPPSAMSAQREAPHALEQPEVPEQLHAPPSAAPLPPAKPATAAVAEPTDALALRILCFGHAQLLVFGQSLGTRKTTRLELALYLAYQAAEAPQEATRLFRQTIAEALWPGQEERDLGLNLLRSCKSRLAADLRALGLEEAAWLDSQEGEETLCLLPQVETDLAAFGRLTRQIEQHKRGQGWPPETTGEEVVATLARLKQLYQGGFALQFAQEPWIVKARRHYRSLYYAACFELARRFAAHQSRRQAIDLGTEILLEANPSGDLVLREVCTWLASEDPAGRQRWAHEFSRDYRRLTGSHLAQARPGWEALRLDLLRQR